jgi:hypothetical protein
MKIKEHNVETDKAIEREMTKEEVAQLSSAQVERAATQKAKETKEIERQAILDKLGITADEAKILLL